MKGSETPLPDQLHRGPHASEPTYLVRMSTTGAQGHRPQFHRAEPHGRLWGGPSPGPLPLPAAPTRASSIPDRLLFPKIMHSFVWWFLEWAEASGQGVLWEESTSLPTVGVPPAC